MQQKTAITVQGLTKSFKSVPVLTGVDFSVEEGTVFALLGSNGAGKTTIVKILTTLLQPDGGAAEIAGLDVVKKPGEVREIISLTGQYAAVDEMLTGRENMRLIGKLRHLRDVNDKADELLERFQLADAANRRTSTYSGGMRRRLDLAMSLLGSPKIIFLDEPTTGLDPQARADMWDVIRELKGTGVTVFLTTQYLDEADRLADRIAILHKGVIAAEGTPAELKKLLPGGHIELRFQRKDDLSRAAEVFQNRHVSKDEENLTLTIDTNGTVKQITEIFTATEDAGLEVAEFTQKSTTLDDVFMSVIG